MDDIPLWLKLAALALLLAVSAFFSIAETSLMALNRMRLRHLVRQGSRSARLVQALLGRTDRLLGVILIGNNLANAAATALVTAVTLSLFGGNDWVLVGATAAVTFLILVCSEVTPKVIGATYPERIALPAAYVLAPLLKLLTPVVWFVNLFVGALLRLLGVRRGGTAEAQLTSEELRSLVLEGGNFIPQKHRSIVLNLFDLEEQSVDDVMTPRARIEALDLAQDDAAVLQQLRTCYHNKLPVFEGDITRVLGVLHVRKLMHLVAAERSFSREAVRAALLPAYYVPGGTPLFQQLQAFQDNHQRLGLVVDEYGEVQGLVTLEDIVEEFVGEFTTHAPGAGTRRLRWDAEGRALVDGAASLRELNRHLDIALPLDGPRTLNGLIIETVQEIPDAPCCVRFGDVVIEVVHVDEQAVRSARLLRAAGRASSAAKP